MKTLSSIILIIAMVVCSCATTEVKEPGYGYEESQNSLTTSPAEVSIPEEIEQSETPVSSELMPVTDDQSEKLVVANVSTPATECDHPTLFHNTNLNDSNLCAYAHSNCEGDFANFYILFYCGFDQSMTGLIIFYLFAIFLIFKYTAIVVDEYIAAGITKVNEALGFSDTLGAVTLLALANGAGDVITALVAGGGSGGVSYNIGSLYGAGLFVAVCVVAICICQSTEPIVFDKMIIFRDVGYYILSTLITLVFAAFGFIYWWMPVIFLLVYVSLVVFTIVYEKRNPVPKETEADNKLEMATNVENKETSQGGNPMLANLMQATAKRVMTVGTVNALALYVKKKTEMSHQNKAKKFDVRGCVDKVMTLIDLPYIWLCWATCLPVEEEHFTQTRVFVYPVTGVYFAMYIFTGAFYSMMHLYAGIPIMIFLYVFMFFNCRGEQLGSKVMMTFTCLGIVAGLMWTYVLCGLLIDMLNVLGVLLGLDATYLGLTILAVGNALPDALTTISMVAQGNATMAISGGYAGQLFGLLVGFGLAQLKCVLANGPQVFDLFNPASINKNLLDLIVIFTALICLGLTFFWGVKFNYTMNRTFAYIVSAIYLVFIIACSAIAITNAVNNY